MAIDGKQNPARGQLLLESCDRFLDLVQKIAEVDQEIADERAALPARAVGRLIGNELDVLALVVVPAKHSLRGAANAYRKALSMSEEEVTDFIASGDLEKCALFRFPELVISIRNFAARVTRSHGAVAQEVRAGNRELEPLMAAIYELRRLLGILLVLRQREALWLERERTAIDDERRGRSATTRQTRHARRKKRGFTASVSLSVHEFDLNVLRDLGLLSEKPTKAEVIQAVEALWANAVATAGVHQPLDELVSRLNPGPVKAE